MEYIILIALIILGVILVLTILSVKSDKKLKSKLINSFGKIPKQKKCEFESIESYHRYKKTYLANSDIIDDITWNDLDMDMYVIKSFR